MRNAVWEDSRRTPIITHNKSTSLLHDHLALSHGGSDSVYLVRAMGALGAVVGLALVMRFKQAGWVVVVSVVIGYAVGLAVDRLRQKTRQRR